MHIIGILLIFACLQSMAIFGIGLQPVIGVIVGIAFILMKMYAIK